MNIKIKCTQCGCDDLEEVDFPYKAKLDEVAIGIAGESSFYDLHEEVYAETYICTNCGHYEFFNSWLAKSILEKREAKIRTLNEAQNELENLNKQVLEKNNEIQNTERELNCISTQLESLDITIRQSNDLKVKQNELTKKLKVLNDEYQVLLKQQSDVKGRID